MQCTCELNGTATLVGHWTQEDIDALNRAGRVWASIQDGYGFEQLEMDEFSLKERTVPISGTPNGLPGIALRAAWNDWFYQYAKNQDPQVHQELIRRMAEGNLSVFLYFQEENEYDFEYTGESDWLLLSSDGAELKLESVPDQARKDLIRRRQEDGYYKIYVDYFSREGEDEDWDEEDEDWDEDEEDYEDEEDEDGADAEADGEDDNADAWDADFEQRWNKGRTQDWLYEVQEDGSVTLVRYVGPGGAVSVPSELQGHPVAELAGQGTITLESRWSTSVQWRNGAFRNRTDVTAVVLPEGLQAIGEQAFRGCTALTSVTLPEGVRSIGSLAFQGCTALEELDLPSTATKLDWGCFSNCTALRRVSLSKRLKTLPQLAFQGCTSLPSVELPRGMVKIEGSAFAGCTALTEVTIPGQVLEVGQNAFFRCTALERLTLGEKLRDCSEAFQECFSLAEVVLPGSVQNFTRAFQRCGLKSVTLSEGIEAVGDGAFAFCSDLTRVHLPESLRRIEDGAFARCTALPAIAIPAGVKFVGEAAFLGCDALFSGLLDLSGTSDYDISASYDLRDGSWHTWTITGYHGPDTDITVPSEVAGKPIARIAPEAFAGYTSESCAQLRRVVLPHGIRELYPLTFKDCKHLEEVVLPDTLEELSQGVFDGCDALHKLTIPPSVTYFHLQAIPDRAGLTLCVEPSSAAYGFAKANWENISLQLPAADPASLTIAGKTFVLTGDFTHCGGDRDAVKALIEEKGGRCTGSVSGKTSYLVLGDAGGAGDKKIQKAKDLQAEGKDLRIISESDLFQVL